MLVMSFKLAFGNYLVIWESIPDREAELQFPGWLNQLLTKRPEI